MSKVKQHTPQEIAEFLEGLVSEAERNRGTSMWGHPKPVQFVLTLTTGQMYDLDAIIHQLKNEGS